MSEYTFECWSCGDMVGRDWDEVSEDVSGRMAYCSDSCFREDCKKKSDYFNSMRKMDSPYVVGQEESEAKLLARIRDINPYTAHSIEEEEVDSFSGNWHYIWVPDLEELRAWATEDAGEGESVEDVMARIDYTEWEEFIMFTHPVKGIVLIQAYDHLKSLSISVYASKGKVEMDVKPSANDFQK